MSGNEPTLRPGDRWESDRGVCVEIRALAGSCVVLELVGKALGSFAMSLSVFHRVFRHLVRAAWHEV